jgi:hypothetical protein
VPPENDLPAEGGQDQDTPPEPTGIAAAIAKARETLADKGTLGGDDDPPADPPDDEPEDEDQPEDEEDDDELPDEDDDGEDEEEEEPEESEGDDGEDEESEEEEGDEDEEEEPKRFTASLPGRHPGDPDVEIEVDDQATAERINQLRNEGMRREQFDAGMAEITAAQEELAQIEEAFTIDPAGFVLDNLDEENAPNVALALLTEPKIWEALQSTVDALLSDPKELRTLQAEAKAARLETKQRLRDASERRKVQEANAREITGAIDVMIPEAMSQAQRSALVKDLTRDIKEHIERNNLQSLDVKDLPTIVSDRLQLNGIDPLEARKSIKNGKRSPAKPTTKKRSRQKPKSGKQLVKASAKRKKAAASPGPGKKAAPTDPKKLPAGQSIQDRIKAVRKAGGLGTFLGNR